MHLLVLDTTYLCYRAFHAIPGLTHEDVPTSVPFGVFGEIDRLRQEWPKARFCFCFDRGKGARKALNPGYNSAREEKRALASEEEIEARKSLQEQIRRLEHEWLPEAGFRNIFAQPEREADDLVAAICLGIGKEDRATIVGADQDLWQLLAPRVRIWNPQKKLFLTAKKFSEEWGIEPSQWADVKALAGCSSDSVEGVQMVGEKTAAKFLNGSLGTHTKAYKKIAAASELWKENLKLVRLPFPDTPCPQIRKDEITKESWRKVSDRLGMTSIRDKGLLK